MTMTMVVVVRMRVAMTGHRRAAVVFVPVMPQFRLVEQEEEHHAEEQRGEQAGRLDPALEGFGQEVHERGGEQRAGGQAQEVLGIEPAPAVAHAHAHEQRGDPHAADAGDERGGEDEEQIHGDGLSGRRAREGTKTVGAECPMTSADGSSPGGGHRPARRRVRRRRSP